MAEPANEHDATSSANQSSADVLEQGAEVHFTTDRDAAPVDRVEILDSGYVKLYYQYNYSIEIHPPHKIDTIHTHPTDEEENAEWW